MDYFKDNTYVFEIYIDKEHPIERCLYITPKAYYEKEKCVWDSGYPKAITDFLRNALKAYELSDSCFELDEEIINEQVVEILSKCTIATFEQIKFFPEGENDEI